MRLFFINIACQCSKIEGYGQNAINFLLVFYVSSCHFSPLLHLSSLFVATVLSTVMKFFLFFYSKKCFLRLF